MRPHPIVLALALALTAPNGARAQGSPIVDLLVRARGALNDLHYPDADSLAATVLGAFEGRLSRDQRLEALGIRAAAAFPDPAGGGTQHPDSSLAWLRLIVRADPAAPRLRSDLSWPGLDSLYRVARGSVLAIWASPPTEFTLVGPNGVASLEVHGTRPARYQLALLDGAGVSRQRDSASTSDGIEPAILRLRSVFNGAAPALAPGEYRLQIAAHDAESADTALLEYRTTVVAPPLDMMPVPGVFDSTGLRPERVRPARARGILGGLLVGGATIAGSVVLGGSSSGAGSGADGRAFAIGGLLAAGAIVAGLRDHGAAIPANSAFNAKLRSDYAESVRRAREENQRRVTEYRTSIVPHLEQP